MGPRHPAWQEPEVRITALFEAIAVAVGTLAQMFTDQPFPTLAPRRPWPPAETRVVGPPAVAEEAARPAA
jgi:hypothetical protein